ncbi:TniQ family protein [Mycobacterium sp. NPDC050441]|uniref:TniQ family protein n=1 Tax=Mycobacterium sp. NPDC050441 TaxID=3155403 RepID=UPI0033DAE9C4
MGAGRTLPLRVEPLPGEALDSWLEALAQRHGVYFGDVLHRCGIASTGPGGWVRLLDRDTFGRIADVTGFSPCDIDAMALPRNPGARTGTSTRLARNLPSGPWDWRANSRYCPHCLNGNGGRWKLVWRLNWTFACLDHNCLLADACPECHCDQRRIAHSMSHIPHPGLCRGVRQRDTTGALHTCEAHLASVQPISLSNSPIFVDAQQQVMGMLLAAAPVAPQDDHGPLAALATLRVLVRWVAKTIDYAQLEPQTVLAAGESGLPNLMAPYSGRAAPNAAAQTAASIVTALSILNAPNITQAAHTWRDFMIAASHGRIHRLTKSDQGALIPSIRSAHSRAYADANAQHKLRRRFSTSAARHNLHDPAPVPGERRLGKAQQYCAR